MRVCKRFDACYNMSKEVIMKKTLFNNISWLNEEGPFVTLVQPSSFAVKDTSKNKLHFKNIAKDAKDKFVEKYPDVDFGPYQKSLDTIAEDQSLWRSDADSLMFLINRDKHAIMKMGIEVKAHSYVDDIPYLTYLMHDLQLLTHFYVLALNRDSFKVFEYSNRKLNPIELPEDAPVTLALALGDDLDQSGYAHGTGRVIGGSNRGYHGGVGATRDERAVDRQNYFYAVDRYLRDKDILDKNIPIELYTLPENYHIYLDLSKMINLDRNLAILTSPEDFNTNTLTKEIQNSVDAKNQRTVDKLFERLDSYTANGRILKDIEKIKEQALYGSIDTLLVSVERLEKHDYEANRIFFDVMQAGGDVYILHADRRLGPEKMTALLRFRIDE